MAAANFTRRRDLFVDAGFESFDKIGQSFLEEAHACSYPLDELKPSQESLSRSMHLSAERCEAFLSLPLRSLLLNATDLLFQRGGDLALLLWLAKVQLPNISSETLATFVFGVASRLFLLDKQLEAQAMIRFFVDVEFDWGDLYGDLGVSYGFFQARDPNPFVWKCLSFLEKRQVQLKSSCYSNLTLLELGCGIGNDALGFMTSPLLQNYIGTDISDKALTEHANRFQNFNFRKNQINHELIAGDFVTILKNWNQTKTQKTNLIYSYSSLHYFNSQEVKEIFGLVSQLLTPGIGLFCFAIKGQGSLWDGQGIPIYKPDVWLNLDGQSRWFPKESALRDMVVSDGFEVLLHERHEHWSYSEIGKPDIFHYVICSPREKL